LFNNGLFQLSDFMSQYAKSSLQIDSTLLLYISLAGRSIDLTVWYIHHIDPEAGGGEYI
jgi:hypothetical protein